MDGDKQEPAEFEPPSKMDRRAFVKWFGGVFEHSAWVAERAFDSELEAAQDTAAGLHAALCHQFRLAGEQERLGVLTAHPDLAGKLGEAKRLTSHSASEQAGAGLDALSDTERARLMHLNDSYMDRFGFPFIIAVKGLDTSEILTAFEHRINNDRETEFATACGQVERIARLRLDDMLPQEGPRNG